MPGSASLQLEKAVLGHTLGFAPTTAPAAVYLALCMISPPPSALSGGIEPSGMAYARQPCTFALLTSPANVAANTVTTQFPPAAGDWGDLGFFEIWNAVTAGTRLYWGPLVDPSDGITPIVRSIFYGDIVRLQAGTVQVMAT